MNKDFFAGVDPEDAFLDSSNLPGFNKSAIEGRLVRALSSREVYTIGIIFTAILILFVYQLFNLQIIDTEKYADLSQNNHLMRPMIFAERGVIIDRLGRELVWNEPSLDSYSLRKYTTKQGLAHLLGFISYPEVDKAGNWWRREFVAGGGVELSLDNILKGKNGSRLIEVDALQNIVSAGASVPAVNGGTVTLSIDAEVNQQLYNAIANGTQIAGFTGGAGVIIDVQSGDIIAITSYPEYDPNILTDGTDRETIARYSSSAGKPFLNRAVQGTYTPGSIIKPYIASVALQEGIISEHKKILSTGILKIPNPYYPGKYSTFRDWSTKLGWLNMRDAIKMSSSIYFYIIGGGFENQKGLGINKISTWAERFGFGNKTNINLPGEKAGVVPTPIWKKETFGEEAEWNLGNTYHSAIGQYGWLVTPIQAVVYIASVANGGMLHTPSLLVNTPNEYRRVPIDDKNLQVVREGMRRGAHSGTAQALNISGIEVAAKTGTAQIGAHNEYMNSWVVGFWPYENPKFAFAVVLEKAPAETMRGAAPAMRPFFEWLVTEHKSDYVIGKYPDGIKLDITKE